MSRRLTLTIALFTAVLSDWLVAPPPAAARPVRVRSKTTVQAQSRFVRGALQLKGRLTNDDGVPVPAAWLTLSPRPALPSARTCKGLRTLFTKQKFQTDRRGEFCLRWVEPPAQGQVEVVFPGGPYHAASRLSLPYDRAKEQRLETKLRFTPRPQSLNLDQQQVTVSATLGFERASTFAARQGLTVRLEQPERGTVIATALTGGDGKLRFTIDATRLGPPGPSQLRLAFDGTPELSPSQDLHALTQRATVRLQLAGPLPHLNPGKVVKISIQARAAGQLVSGGVVEAVTQHGTSLGSATVDAGMAQVVLPGPSGHDHRLPMMVRYVPGPPWFAASEPLALVLTAAPANTAVHLLLGLLLLASACWIGLTWRRSRRRPQSKKAAPPLTPGVHLVGKRTNANRWTGKVVDAHDGSPIGSAILTLCRPSLLDNGQLFTVPCDNQGYFAFELTSPIPEHAVIETGSIGHTTERCPLPAAGQICIALSTRRRASLARFIAWARRQGKSSHLGPEPTPAEIFRATGSPRAAKDWAHTVEGAVFGPDPVDEQMEQHLKSTEPKPHATSRQGTTTPSRVDDAP